MISTIRSLPGMSRSSRASARPYAHHTPFDLLQCDTAFPRLKPAADDSQLTEALIRRGADLTPSAHELAAITRLVDKVKAIFESPDISSSIPMHEVQGVGSHRMETILAGHCIADLVVVLRSRPTRDLVLQLASKVGEALQKEEAAGGDIFSVAAEGKGVLGGFEVSSSDAALRVLVTTTKNNFDRLDPDKHLGSATLRGHYAAVDHARWFVESARHPNVLLLARILKDLRSRFPALQGLSPWLSSLLAHYCVISNPSRQPLNINLAFRRCLKLLSAGFFLPNSAGITDPCQAGNVRAHADMSLQQQDEVCSTAQTLLRVLSYGGYSNVLGTDDKPDILSEVTSWDGVVVTPSKRTFVSKDSGETTTQ